MEQSFIANVAQMNLIIIVVVTLLAGVLGLSLYRVAVGGLTRLPDTNDAKSVIETLDVLAFNNLIDPAEEKFLREELPLSTFRSIQRLRLRAALEYVGCASRNAAVLIRMGKAVAPEAGAQRSREVQDLVTAAVHLRLLSILVVCLLWIKIAFPGLRLSLKEISALHGRLVSQQASLNRVKNVGRLLEPS